MNKSTKGYNGTPQARQRRKTVIILLEAQLATGMKPGKRPVRGINVTLEDADIKRINSELSILKTRI